MNNMNLKVACCCLMLMVAGVLAEKELKRVKRQDFSGVGADFGGDFGGDFIGDFGGDYFLDSGVGLVTAPSTGPVLIDNSFPIDYGGIAPGFASYDYYGGVSPAFGVYDYGLAGLDYGLAYDYGLAGLDYGIAYDYGFAYDYGIAYDYGFAFDYYGGASSVFGGGVSGGRAGQRMGKAKNKNKNKNKSKSKSKRKSGKKSSSSGDKYGSNSSGGKYGSSSGGKYGSSSSSSGGKYGSGKGSSKSVPSTYVAVQRVMAPNGVNTKVFDDTGRTIKVFGTQGYPKFYLGSHGIAAVSLSPANDAQAKKFISNKSNKNVVLSK